MGVSIDWGRKNCYKKLLIHFRTHIILLIVIFFPGVRKILGIYREVAISGN